MKRPKVLLLNLSGIGCRSTSKMAAQSYSEGINQQMCVELSRYCYYFVWISASKVGVAEKYARRVA